MKFRIVIVLVAIALAWFAGRHVHVGMSADSSTTTTFEGGQEEIRQSFQLAPGARVEVKSINGSVDVEAVDSDTAEVHVVRTARDKSDLERHKIVIEQTPTSLTVYGKKGDGSFWDRFGGGQVQTKVMLKIPRRSELTTKGVNGPVQIGALEGAVHLSGINGRVEVAQAVGFAEVSGINGGVSIGVARLSEQGLTVKGINGGVTILVADSLNADVHIRGLNGGVSLDVPNVTQHEKTRSTVRAKIGTGGTPISISGINGGVHFEQASKR